MKVRTRNPLCLAFASLAIGCTVQPDTAGPGTGESVNGNSSTSDPTNGSPGSELGGSASTRSPTAKGGNVAESKIPAALQLRRGCSAAYVGPHHVLTSTSCAVQHVNPVARIVPIAAGGTIELTQDPQVEPRAYHKFTVNAVVLHPQAGVPGVRRGRDVALLVTHESLRAAFGEPSSVYVQPTPLAEGTPVRVTGFGTEDTTDTQLRRVENRRLRFADTVVTNAGTPTAGYFSTRASLAGGEIDVQPGDQGSPVLVDCDTGKCVAGLNATDPSGLLPPGARSSNPHVQLDAWVCDAILRAQPSHVACLGRGLSVDSGPLTRGPDAGPVQPDAGGPSPDAAGSAQTYTTVVANLATLKGDGNPRRCFTDKELADYWDDDRLNYSRCQNRLPFCNRDAELKKISETRLPNNGPLKEHLGCFVNDAPHVAEVVGAMSSMTRPDPVTGEGQDICTVLPGWPAGHARCDNGIPRCNKPAEKLVLAQELLHNDAGTVKYHTICVLPDGVQIPELVAVVVSSQFNGQDRCNPPSPASKVNRLVYNGEYGFSLRDAEGRAYGTCEGNLPVCKNGAKRVILRTDSVNGVAHTRYYSGCILQSKRVTRGVNLWDFPLF